jgi:surface antigen
MRTPSVCARLSVAVVVVLGALFVHLVPVGADTSVRVGDVRNFGDAGFFGTTDSRFLHAPLIGIAATSSGRGYWLAARDGGVFTFGDARFYGSAGNLRLTQPVVGIAATPSGRGYWLVARDGGVFSFGDARFFGSTGNLTLRRPIVGIAATPTARGYWLAASDGGVFSYGDAQFFGSAAAVPGTHPFVGITTTRGGDGYWLVGRDGAVFAFGRAAFLGALGAASLGRDHAVGVARSPSGRGYWILATVADTGGYPDAGMPCEHAPYLSAGYCTSRSGPYDWGPVPDWTPGWTVAASRSSRGYGYRNCTDWVAWRLEQTGVPSRLVIGLGNGGQWAVNSRGRAGLTVSASPRRGDAAVQAGNPGHVAFVEAVYADGAIQVSEYNKSFDGTYDDSRIGTPAQLGFSAFIRFS